MTIKLSEALKNQRTIIQNQKSNQRIIIKHNSYIENDNTLYRIKALEEEQQNLKEDLIALKMAVRTANDPIAEDIFRLSELKEEQKRFEKINTREGTYLEKDSNSTVVYKVHFTRDEIKDKLKSVLASKREIESKLDKHNKETEITVDFKSNLMNKKAA